MASRTTKKAPAKSVGVTDKKLAELGRAYETLRLQVKTLETEQEGYKKTILEELTRRGTKALEHGGVKVTKVAQPWTSYSYDRLRHLLGKQAGRYRQREVDVAALSRAIQAGEVDAAVLDEITTTGTKAAYVSVTLAK